MMTKLNTDLFVHRAIKPVYDIEPAESGAACLIMIAQYYGLQSDIVSIRRLFPVSGRGASLDVLMVVASHLGLAARPVNVQIQNPSLLNLPAILDMGMGHYVVIEAIRKNRALIHDPLGRSGWEDIEIIWPNIVGKILCIEPSLDFEIADMRQKIKITDLWSKIVGTKRAFGQIILLSLTLQAFVLITPYYTQIAIDRASPSLDTGLLLALSVIFIIVAVSTAIASLLRASVMLSIGASIGFSLTSNLARRLFRLPTNWFGQRTVGDVLTRFQSTVPIRQLLTEEAPIAIVDGIFAIVTLIALGFYSKILMVIALSSAGLYFILKVSLLPRQRYIQESLIGSIGKEQTTLIESIRAIRTIRLFGQEMPRYLSWQEKMTDSLNNSIKYQRILNWQASVKILIIGIESIISIYASIRLLMNGTFSIGMIFAYAALKTQFLVAAMSLADKSALYRVLSVHLGRIADIALAEEASCYREIKPPRSLPAGQIELRDIGFRYGTGEPMIFDGINACFERGTSTALTGPSGAGKSTLLEIILGLSAPTNGTVLIDGIPLAEYGYRNYWNSIAAVLQDDFLLAGSIAENIAMFGDPDASLMRLVTDAASISADIEAMPMGLKTLIGEGGAGLSGGQRQRLLLARALYRQPKILIVDEGTSSLDEDLERKISSAIADLGITRIIVAHRRTTILSCQRILFLRDRNLSQIERKHY